jgi:hypothetical protein
VTWSSAFVASCVFVGDVIFGDTHDGGVFMSGMLKELEVIVIAETCVYSCRCLMCGR